MKCISFRHRTGNPPLTKSLPSLMGCSRLTGHWISSSFFFFSLYSLTTTSIYGSAGSLNADDLSKYNSSLDLSSDLQPPVQTFCLSLHLYIKCPSHTQSIPMGPMIFSSDLSPPTALFMACVCAKSLQLRPALQSYRL